MDEDRRNSGHEKNRENQPREHSLLESENAILNWNLTQDLSSGHIYLIPFSKTPGLAGYFGKLGFESGQTFT